VWFDPPSPSRLQRNVVVAMSGNHPTVSLVNTIGVFNEVHVGATVFGCTGCITHAPTAVVYFISHTPTIECVAYIHHQRRQPHLQPLHDRPPPWGEGGPTMQC
jgi:hypothetical protein